MPSKNLQIYSFSSTGKIVQARFGGREIGFDWLCIGFVLGLIGFDWVCIGFDWVCIGFVFRDCENVISFIILC